MAFDVDNSASPTIRGNWKTTTAVNLGTALAAAGKPGFW